MSVPDPIPPALPPPSHVGTVPYAHIGWTAMAKARKKGPSGNPGRWFLFAPAWVLVGAAIIAIGATAIGALFALRGVIGGAFVGASFFLMMAIVASIRAARRARELAVLGYVEQAVRLNLPLPAMLRAAERAERPIIGRALASVRGRLEEGYPLSDALWLMPGGMPPALLAEVEAGERACKLDSALGRVVRNERTRGSSAEPAGDFMIRWYLITYTFCIAGGTTLVGTFVLPKFRQIFEDFGFKLPAITRWVMDGWEILSTIVFPIACVLLLVEVGRIGGGIISPRLVRLRPFDWLTDPLAWYLPLWRGVTRSRASATLCHHLADAIESGRSTTTAVAEAIAMRTNRVLMRRTRVWAKQLVEGRPLAESAADAGIPPAIVGMLATARGSDAMIKSLRFLGDYFDSRAIRAGNVRQAILIPLIALAAGLFVGSLAVGLILPLSEMADGIMNKATHGGPM